MSIYAHDVCSPKFITTWGEGKKPFFKHWVCLFVCLFLQYMISLLIFFPPSKCPQSSTTLHTLRKTGVEKHKFTLESNTFQSVIL